MVKALERQFEADGNKIYQDVFEATVLTAEGTEGAEELPLEPFPEEDFDEVDDMPLPEAGEPTRAQRQAVQRLHVNTGHRSPLRLAKALMLAGASPEVIKAAKEIRCETCHETQRPKSHMTASLPKPRQFGDQMHIDLVAVKDGHQNTFWIMHGIDAASGYQSAMLMDRKTSEEVVRFFETIWIPALGAPRTVVADCGPEFTSDKMQFCMDLHDILLYHIPVETPWSNGMAERAGAALKVMINSLVKQFACTGFSDMRGALAHAVEACNQDIGEAGYSPAQFVLGKQPRTMGEVIPGDMRLRLAQHSLIENNPSLARSAAMKEAARVALVRLKYSRSLRKAEFTRARKVPGWNVFKAGDIIYFFREQKAASTRGAKKKKKLLLRQWHGPAMVIAIEGGRVPTAAYVSYRGNLTKCAMQHLRHASTLERLSGADWKEMLEEVIAAVEEEAPTDGGDLRDDRDEDGDEDSGEDGDGPGDDEMPDPDAPDNAGGDLGGAPEGATSSSPPTSMSRPSVQPFPYPFSSADLLPMATLASSRASGTASGFSSRKSSLATTLEGQAGGDEVKPTVSLEPVREETTEATSPIAVAADSISAPSSMTQPVSSSLSSPMPLPLTGEDEAARGAMAARGAEEIEERGAPRLERAQGSVRRALSEGATIEQDSKRRAFAPLVLGGKSIDVMLAEQDTCIHPLLRAVKEAQEDLEKGFHFSEDHGTWDGRWSMLSRGDYEALMASYGMLPTGGVLPGHEALQTGSHKEIQWSRLSEADREQFRLAAKEQWNKWLENSAVEVLSLSESKAVLRELQRKDEMSRVLKPRYVLTDKNASHRTESCPLPLKAAARIVVPGYRDIENLRGELRRDAPTGSRLAQHVLFCLIAAHPLWFLRAADVRAAFLKGDPYVRRVLYMTGADGSKGPTIPIPQGCVARVLKGVFGLADAPREWWLRLDRELRALGWERSSLDGALWFLRQPQAAEGESGLHGVIVGHVDDLLFGGDSRALESLEKLGNTLGFGSIEKEDFTWCGKRIRRDPDTKEIVVSMTTYHAQLTPLVIPRARRQELEAPLTPQEVKKLKGILGSLQWLTAQLRFDIAFQVSSLQSEKPTVSTLLRANKALVETKKDADFELRFRNIDYMQGGLMMVSDAALGNVDEQGRISGATEEKVHSQSCYIVMWVDDELLAGRSGRFNTVDFRSHRIPRVCRSSYAAETLGCEEGFDAAELLRGFFAEARGLPVHGKDAYLQVTRIPLVGVTDAKDTYDRINSDTGFGSQKSLMFTIANLRQNLRRPQTALRWTATSNMFIDGGTKLMDTAHLRTTLQKGSWSVVYNPEFVKQTVRKKKEVHEEEFPDGELPGRVPATSDGELLQWARHFAEAPGWHFVDGVGVNVSHQASSMRSPSPRFTILDFPLRTVVSEFLDGKGLPTWRILEERVDLKEKANHQEKLPRRAHRLISFFQPQSKATENTSDVKS